MRDGVAGVGKSEWIVGGVDIAAAAHARFLPCCLQP